MKTQYLGTATERRKRRASYFYGVLILTLLFPSYLVVSGKISVPKRFKGIISHIEKMNLPVGLNLFKIGSIQIEGNEYLLKEELLSVAEIRYGESLLKLDPDGVERRLLSHPRIKYARVTRRIPGTVKILVKERHPFALIQLGRLYEIDRDGTVLSPLFSSAVPDLPIISGIRLKKVSFGQRIENEKLSLALRIVSELLTPEVGLFKTVSEINFSPSGTIVLYTTGRSVKATLSPEDLRREKLLGLRLVLNDLMKKGIDAESVDLRFENQFVVSKKGESNL